MSIKLEAKQLVDQLDENANWDDLVRELIRQRKVTIGMRDEEIQQADELTMSDANAIMARLNSSNSLPDDMRNTNKYKPGNATTFGMVAGILAILFVVIPPISWIAAVTALVAGAFGMVKKEEKAWIPILLAIVSLFAYFVIDLGA